MLHIPGGPALSRFRTDKLLARAREAVPDIELIHANTGTSSISNSSSRPPTGARWSACSTTA
jgi:hypothetical protein